MFILKAEGTAMQSQLPRETAGLAPDAIFFEEHSTTEGQDCQFPRGQGWCFTHFLKNPWPDVCAIMM